MITLTKNDEPAELDGVTHLSVGVSWDPTSGSSGGLIGKLRQKVGTDLDLIAVAMQGNDPVRLAGLDSLDPLQGSSTCSLWGQSEWQRGEKGRQSGITVDLEAYSGKRHEHCLYRRCL